MKLEEEGDEILGVETCTDNDDVLLTASSGQCIRFPRRRRARVCQSRNSVGVRGIAMGENDRAISMTILEHVDATPAERAAYLKRSVAERQAGDRRGRGDRADQRGGRRGGATFPTSATSS